jgi:hypothetical protein
MEEIRPAIEKYQPNIFIIDDELFAAKPERLAQFSQAVIAGREKYGWDFDWAFQTHINAKLDYETLVVAREAGCRLIGYGVESASPTVLASMNKKTTPEHIIEKFRMTEKARIAVGANYIYGDPAENISTVKETLSFAMKHSRGNHIYHFPIHPYPGSKLHTDALEQGIIKSKVWYYENIDELEINLTKIPDLIWQPWIHLLTILGNAKFLWVKNAWSKYGLVECPFCHAINYHSPPKSIAVKWIRGYSRKYKWKLVAMFGLVWWHPLFWQLRRLLGIPGAGFLSVCPRCGKRLWITVIV